MAVNKDALVEAVKETGVVTTKKASKEVVDAVIDTIVSTLSTGEEVSITGFGKLQVVATAPRKGRNPQTGEEIQIPAGKKIRFKAAKALKEAVKG